MKQYEIWCDGAIRGNGTKEAISASASLISNEAADSRFLISLEEHHTSSNIAEMLGAIQALVYVKWSAKFKIYSDSEYLVKGFMERMDKWEQNGWKLRSGGEVSNLGLWSQLSFLAKYHDITMIHVKGHTGAQKNEIVDELAKKVLKDPEEYRLLTTYKEKRLIFIN